jgi:hypothetical protein
LGLCLPSPRRVANSTAPAVRSRQPLGRDGMLLSLPRFGIRQARTRSGISRCRTGAGQGGHTAHSWKEMAPLAQLLLLTCVHVRRTVKLAHCPACNGTMIVVPPFFFTTLKNSGKCREGMLSLAPLSLSEKKKKVQKLQYGSNNVQQLQICCSIS